MATGVKPRDDDLEITKRDIEVFEDAMKNKQFRELLVEYCEEVRDPANQALYQKEMTQLEKERGYDVTFINPKEGYVIKTSVAGDKKAFINICSNENIGKPAYKVKVVNGSKGLDWSIPYSIIPPRYDYDNKKEKCVIYDVVFHPDALRMAEVNKRFRELVNRTAFDGLKEAFNVDLDNNNFRFPKSSYKGMSTPAVIRKEDPNYNSTPEDEMIDLTPDILEKLYPQRSYSESIQSNTEKERTKPKVEQNSFQQCTNSYTTPKYVIKQQKNVDIQDFTNDRNSKQYVAVPSKIVVEINLPLLSSTKDCNLDVQEKSLSLISEKPAKYKLNIQLPYSVNEQCGNAQFDKTKRVLTVTLPVIRMPYGSDFMNSKLDSGVDSEECSQSDEEASERLVTEISSGPATPQVLTSAVLENKAEEYFLNPSIGYTFPQYTHNVLDNMIAFTFHVKNTDPESVAVLTKNDCVQIKFTSIGSGFTPVHYAALIIFHEEVEFHNVSGEAWDNNVILQMELTCKVPQEYKIGLDENSLVCEHFNFPITTKIKDFNENINNKTAEITNVPHLPVVEVTNLGSETNIIVTPNKVKEFDDRLDQVDENDHTDDPGTPTSPKVEGFVSNDVNENCTKGILRKSIRIARSLSESSVDIASSVDYFSSDCIPEESSLKKTVRFNEVIARQFYRYNSSIEGQKKKNQRKKSKKRNQERHKSESEAEDDALFSKTDACKTKLKSALKQRRDSGLADTSDAEVEFKSSIDSTIDSPVFQELIEKPEDPVFSETANCHLEIDERKIGENKKEPVMWQAETNSTNKASKAKTKKCKPLNFSDIKHSSDFYDPDKLNKGQYLEVKFKNDLIFDLDM